MFNSLKCIDRVSDYINRNIHIVGNAYSPKNILKIMLAKNLYLIYIQDFCFLTLAFNKNLSISYECTLFRFNLMTKPHNLSFLNLIHTGSCFWIIIIQDDIIISRLILCYSEFCIYIIFKCMMSVQMIWCQIENCRNMRFKLFNSLKLERTYLSRHQCIFICRISKSRRKANISNHQ